MRYELLVLILAACLCHAESRKVQPVAFTKSDKAVPADSKIGKVFLQGREQMVEVVYPSGREPRPEVLVLFDRGSGVFLWEYVEPGDRHQTPGIADAFGRGYGIAYADEHRLLTFTIKSGPSPIFIHESSETADGLDDAESMALQQVADNIAKLASGEHWKTYHEVSLRSLEREFLGPKFSAVNGPIKLVGVSRTSKGWEIVIKGQWTEKLVLDEQFNLVDKVRLD